jgi:branched-chain amino acid transport system permease protein
MVQWASGPSELEEGKKGLHFYGSLSLEFFVQQMANGVMMGAIYCLLVVGLVIILSMMDIVNFAHGQLAMLAGYITIFAMNRLGLNFLFTILACVAVMAIIAFGLEKAVIRPARKKKLPLLIAGIATVGMALALEEIAAIFFGRTQESVVSPWGGESVRLGPIQTSLIRLIIPLIVAVLVAGLFLFLYRTRVGKALRAVSQDAEATALQGINVDNILSIGFMLSVALAAFAGTLLAQMRSMDPYMGVAISNKAFAIIIVGGMMSLPGAIAAAFLLGVGEVMVSGYIGANWADLFFFGMMVIVLLVRPNGLFGGGHLK